MSAHPNDWITAIMPGAISLRDYVFIDCPSSLTMPSYISFQAKRRMACSIIRSLII